MVPHELVHTTVFLSISIASPVGSPVTAALNLNQSVTFSLLNYLSTLRILQNDTENKGFFPRQLSPSISQLFQLQRYTNTSWNQLFYHRMLAFTPHPLYA